ncbi:hypothetical protein Lfu02_14980 [Longispora fulva]|uniref:Uncharacterized protein n=2 Tax=Longispora fulva TaxID=619741 RepID=A0A8J7KZ90_9ACTN|nr:hypothetical protein [Longispora fulva]MBG6140492.1 hypothetical protein [Longispora fulva]GIG57126.1 hypothetical protein Lfu02_14980 [Longispora fulva]
MLTVHRDDPEGATYSEVKCDLELTDDCHYTLEIDGEPGQTEEQVAAVAASEHGWVFNVRQHKWACPPCAARDQQRRRASTLASEAYPRAISDDVIEAAARAEK